MWQPVIAATKATALGNLILFSPRLSFMQTVFYKRAAKRRPNRDDPDWLLRITDNG